MIKKEEYFHDDGVTPIAEMHPDAQERMDRMEEALATIAEAIAKLNEHHANRPKGFSAKKQKDGSWMAEPVN